jgi:hypothetical protein
MTTDWLLVAGAGRRDRRLLAEGTGRPRSVLGGCSLNSDSFAAREEASRQLEAFGELAEPALRLEKLAQGASEARLTQEAKASQRRLARRAEANR